MISGIRRGGLLAGCIIAAVVPLIVFSLPLLRYKHALVGFDVPKDAVLKTFNPRTLTSDTRSALGDADPSFAFGRLTDRRMFLEENVPVSALYLVVNKKELTTLGKTTTRSYVLWQTANGGYVGNATQPSIIKTYHPIEVTLLKQEGKRYQLNVQCSEHDPLPLAGTRWYEVD